MYHISVELTDEDAGIEQVERAVNHALAPLSVQVIRSYSNERIGDRRWFLILRGVTAENWLEVSSLLAKALRNQPCRYHLRQPTARRGGTRLRP